MASHPNLCEKYDAGSESAPPRLTKYEFTRLRGYRLEQLARGALPLVHWTSNDESIESVFLREFREKRIPILIQRKQPNGAQIRIPFANFDIDSFLRQ